MPSRRRAATGGNGRGNKGGRYRGRAGNAAHGGRSAGGGQGQGGQGGGDHGILSGAGTLRLRKSDSGSQAARTSVLFSCCGMLAQFCVPLGIFLAAAYFGIAAAGIKQQYIWGIGGFMAGWGLNVLTDNGMFLPTLSLSCLCYLPKFLAACCTAACLRKCSGCLCCGRCCCCTAKTRLRPEMHRSPSPHRPDRSCSRMA